MASVDGASPSSPNALADLARRVSDYARATKPVKGADTQLAQAISDVVKDKDGGVDLRRAIGDNLPAQQALSKLAARSEALRALFPDKFTRADLTNLLGTATPTVVPEGTRNFTASGAARINPSLVQRHFEDNGDAVVNQAAVLTRAPISKSTARRANVAKGDGPGTPQVISGAPADIAQPDTARADEAAGVAAERVDATDSAIPAPVLQAVGEVNPDPNKAPINDTIAQPIDGAPPPASVIVMRMLDGIQATLNGRKSSIAEAQDARIADLNKLKAEVDATKEKLKDVLAKKPSARDPEEQRQVLQLQADEKSLKEKGDNIRQSSRDIESVTSVADLGATLYGLRTAHHRETTASLDEDSRFNIDVLGRLLDGSDSGALSPEQRAIIDKWRTDPANQPTVDELKKRLGVVDSVASYTGSIKIPPDERPLLDAVAKDSLKKYLMTSDMSALAPVEARITELQERLGGLLDGEKAGGPPNAAARPGISPSAANAPQAQAAAAASAGSGRSAPAGVVPNTFGLSSVRRAELMKLDQGDLVQAIDQYNETLRAYYMKSASRLAAMRGILSAGMPIEAVLVLFMALMTENEEDKLKLKMTETTVAEGFERANRKIETDRNWARDLLKKYRADQIPEEYREKVDLSKLSALAGERPTDEIDEASAKKIRDEATSWEQRLYADPPDPTLSQTELENLRLQYPQELLEARKKQTPVKAGFEYVDVSLNPSDYGFTTKSSSTLTQEMQAQAQSYKQMIETFTSVLRMLQDMVNKIVTNIR